MVHFRRIEHFALPFLLGTAAASSSSAFLCANPAAASAVALSAALALLCDIFLIYRHGARDLPLPLLWGAVFLCAFVCVIRCGACAPYGGDRPLTGGRLAGLLAGIGEKFKEVIDSLPFDDGQNNALVKALLTGDRSGLSRETAASFRDSGAAHILALSGLHLGIIYGVTAKAVRILGNSPSAAKIKSVLIILTTGAYCIMVGSGPSISRAFLFILIRESAALAGRTGDLRTTLCSSFVLQICIDAEAVRSVSFQLSYLAIAGIAYIHPFLKNMYPPGGPRRSPLRWIWDSASLSIACQTATGPLAWARFGTFPVYFIITNLISLPLTGILIPSAILTSLLQAAGCCPTLAVKLTALLADTLRESLKIIAGMQNA